jgi:hypothetical protein
VQLLFGGLLNRSCPDLRWPVRGQIWYMKDLVLHGFSTGIDGDDFSHVA